MRFQELMPDVLHWLGIRKIHRLVSMSNVKYDAITGSGIEVGERVKIPDALVPADARVEMEAKMAAGYFTDGAVPDAKRARRRSRAAALSDGARRRAPTRRSRRLRDAGDDPRALRPRSRAAVTRGRSAHFTLDREPPRRRRRPRRRASRAGAIPTLRIPYHSRWRHFEAGGVDRKAALDARARRPQRRRARARAHRPRASSACCSTPAPAPPGATSKPRAGSASRAPRASASRAFAPSWPGAFSSDAGDPLRVDAAALAALDARALAAVFQVQRRQPAGRPRRPRRAAAPAGRRAARAAGDVRRARRGPARCSIALTRDGDAHACRPRDDPARAARRASARSGSSGSTLRRRAARRRVAAPARRRRGRDRRLGAVPQAVAVARATRCSSRSSGPACTVTELDALTGAARVPQRRPAARHRRDRAARRRLRGAHAARRPTSSSSSGAR